MPLKFEFHSSNAHHSQDWARTNKSPKCHQSPLWVMDPSYWAITCHLQAYTLTGSWNQKWNWNSSTDTTNMGLQVSHLNCCPKGLPLLAASGSWAIPELYIPRALLRIVKGLCRTWKVNWVVVSECLRALYYLFQVTGACRVSTVFVCRGLRARYSTISGGLGITIFKTGKDLDQRIQEDCETPNRN